MVKMYNNYNNIYIYVSVYIIIYIYSLIYVWWYNSRWPSSKRGLLPLLVTCLLTGPLSCSVCVALLSRS